MPISVFVPRAESIVNWTLITSAAYTTSNTTNYFQMDSFSSAGITVVVTTCSGTLDVYVQKLLPDGSTYGDIAAFPQYTTAIFTTTGARTLNFVNGGNAFRYETNAAITNSSIITAHMGGHWRINFAIAGTSGTSTFGVFGDFQS